MRGGSVKPAPFRYFSPHSLEDALEWMHQYGDEARLLAGGQSLIASLNFRCLQPAVLIDLNPLSELAYIRPSDSGGVLIGALTRQRSLEFDALIADSVPLLHTAIPYIAHPAIRNRGTLGGSLAYA